MSLKRVRISSSYRVNKDFDWVPKEILNVSPFVSLIFSITSLVVLSIFGGLKDLANGKGPCKDDLSKIESFDLIIWDALFYGGKTGEFGLEIGDWTPDFSSSILLNRD